MTNEKHKATLDALRNLGTAHSAGTLIYAGVGQDPWRLCMTIGGTPGVDPAALASLIADLLNEAMEETR